MDLVFSKSNILLVDDRQSNLDALAAALENPAYNLVLATSGSQALHHLNKQEFAVVLLDVMMPEMDGFATAAKIRQCPTCRATPIIFVSAVADDMNFVFKGYSAGAVDYIVKPIEIAVVKAKVAIFVELFQAKERLRMQLAETRSLCRKLEKENNERQRKVGDVIEQLQSLISSFEECSSQNYGSQSPVLKNFTTS